jgi:hypothetical protein
LCLGSTGSASDARSLERQVRRGLQSDQRLKAAAAPAEMLEEGRGLSIARRFQPAVQQLITHDFAIRGVVSVKERF